MIKKYVPVAILLIFSALTSFGQTKKDSLYVFVGEKIEAKEWPQSRTFERIDTIIIGTKTTFGNSVSVNIDSRFAATYKILQQVYGTYKADTIQFIAFDHYGTPAFTTYKRLFELIPDPF